MGDKIDVFIPLNQDTMDRHLHLLKARACAIYDSEKITPAQAAEGVQLNPIPMAIVCGATYVARAFSGKQKHMVEMFKGAIQHKGFALVDVFSSCVTYNKDNTHQWFNPRVKMLEEQGHDPTDLHKSNRSRLPMGRRNPHRPLLAPPDLETLEEQEPDLHTGEGPLAFRSNLRVPPEQAKALIQELL
jgi:2-oxoglutarate ferredoxin oxidoreductase subunit beta